jgi:transcriptional regulator with XRE-family HTH domain
MPRENLPQSVQNLRRIWDAKKVEMRFTQVEAAKTLGWSQGAISHYLNNITKLQAPAIVKLANFLDVDPREIDPTIEPHLPSVERRLIAFDATDTTKPLNETILSRKDDSSIMVRIPRKEPYLDLFFERYRYSACYVRLISPSELKEPRCYAARLKGKKSLEFFEPTNLPEASKIHTLWSVVAFVYY